MMLSEKSVSYAGYPVNYYEVVPHLLGIYQDWSEEDVVSFLEEKTGRRVHPEDHITLRAVYRRCLREMKNPSFEGLQKAPDRSRTDVISLEG